MVEFQKYFWSQWKDLKQYFLACDFHIDSVSSVYGKIQLKFHLDHGTGFYGKNFDPSKLGLILLALSGFQSNKIKN